MLGTRHEEYEQHRYGLPFVLNANIARNYSNGSKQNNWHENLEIQFCVKGNGVIFLDGTKYLFSQGDIAIANSNVIHYTGTEKELVYDALIIGTDFCKQIDFDLGKLYFKPLFNDEKIFRLFSELKRIYLDLTVLQRKAKLNKLLLEILIELAENYTLQNKRYKEKSKSYERIKKALLYIRDNYEQKIVLEEIAKAVLCDKYTLCKDFKKYTGQTVFENLNHYRCVRAIDYLSSGYSIAETASLCGFDNFSYFTKTFKKYIGKLPSQYKKQL